MKKSILNLGKVLSRSEQQQLLAGNVTQIKHEGDLCDSTADSRKPSGCHCNRDSDCASLSCSEPWGGAAAVCS